MAKNLKLNIKNTQIAEAINLGSLKSKLAKKKTEAAEESAHADSKLAKESVEDQPKEMKEESPRIRARSKSAFAEGTVPEIKTKDLTEDDAEGSVVPDLEETSLGNAKSFKTKTSEELRKEIFGEEIEEQHKKSVDQKKEEHTHETTSTQTPPSVENRETTKVSSLDDPKLAPVLAPAQPSAARPRQKEQKFFSLPPPKVHTPRESSGPRVTLGPTGKHVNDLLPQRKEVAPVIAQKTDPQKRGIGETDKSKEADKNKPKPKIKGREGEVAPVETEEELAKKGAKAAKFKEFKDVKPAPRKQEVRSFDARDRHGFRDAAEEEGWRRKRHGKQVRQIEDPTIRPTSLKIRIPIAIKDLASEMKLKASQLIAKLFLQGLVVTLNDLLEDETTIQLLGHEFGCELVIDTTEEERIRITDKTIKEEIGQSIGEALVLRPPVVTFMGHVDHGKTSLIDSIRKSNRAAGEAGAITQHIGAFRCHTPVGDIAILDTPGHEAFSAMRARGADVTDIVVLVVAGDEGIKQQTTEAIQHAKAAKVPIVVAINKSDKPNFNPETVYRQLSENDLLPEAWGGQIITVNCSAHTGEGVQTLLEMLALQAEVMELQANPEARARGTVLESEMHKGMGIVATVLVQNGTLKLGNCLVFDHFWGKVKTMHNEFGRELQEAGPSTPVEITGISGLPDAGQEFIVVKNEREAREIAEARMQGRVVHQLQKRKVTMESLLLASTEGTKKILNIVLRADVQGSLEALKVALEKIESTKADLNIIFSGVGEISESDVQLAAASKAVIVGFHTQIESHAENLIKQVGVQILMHDIIYHVIDDVKSVMGGLLDKIAIETEKGKAIVKATFKSSHYGIIAGCQVSEGSITRNNQMRVSRKGEIVWKGSISSLKRVKEDVREVSKGLECGIVLNNYSDYQEGDILEAYEVTYITQEL